MKPRRLTTKRRSPRPGVFKKLHASVRRKKQRAATAAARPSMDIESDVPNLGISRAIVVLLLIHVVAIGGMFAHSKWFADSEQPVVIKEDPNAPARESTPQTTAPVSGVSSVPKHNFGHTPYVVETRDTYGSIAAAHEVDEFELRRLNNNSQLRSGRILRLPPKMVRPAAMVTRSAPAAAAPVAISIDDIPDPVVPTVAAPTPAAPTPAAASGKTYTVKSGDTVWRITQKFGIGQKELMSLNGISDPSKLKIGQVLKIPN